MPTEIEKENLEAHVELCAQRYDALEKRLTNVEHILSGLKATVEAGQLNTIKVLVGTAGTIIVAVLGLLGVVLQKIS